MPALSPGVSRWWCSDSGERLERAGSRPCRFSRFHRRRCGTLHRRAANAVRRGVDGPHRDPSAGLRGLTANPNVVRWRRTTLIPQPTRTSSLGPITCKPGRSAIAVAFAADTTWPCPPRPRVRRRAPPHTRQRVRHHGSPPVQARLLRFRGLVAIGLLAATILAIGSYFKPATDDGRPSLEPRKEEVGRHQRRCSSPEGIPGRTNGAAAWSCGG